MNAHAKTADLHLHTYFSDGTESPERVVTLAKAAGLSAIAITDHDNTDAFAIAQPVAAREGIELLTGIEMSASDGPTDVHVLGFLMNLQHPGLQQYLTIQKARRVQRVKDMVQRLRQAGVQIDAEEVLALAKQGTVGRPHVAQILLKHGYITSVSEAFTRYLGPKNPGYVPGSPMAPSEVIRIIREAGGLSVLAHPVYMERDLLIDQLVREGLVGLEVYHSGHPPEVVRRYEAIADRLKLLKTGGSDFHGTPKEGLPVGAVKIPYVFVEVLKAWKARQTSASCA